jgi:hypothetical protein
MMGVSGCAASRNAERITGKLTEIWKNAPWTGEVDVRAVREGCVTALAHCDGPVSQS